MSDVVLASDRGPVTFIQKDGGLHRRPRLSSVTGVLHTAARGLSNEVTWLATSTSAGDASAVTSGLFHRLTSDLGYAFEPIVFDPAAYRAYYEDVGVRMFWFAHHELWTEVPTREFGEPDQSAIDAYQLVNRRFAERIAERSKPDALVLFHDYQLATAPKALRQLRPRQPIAHFTHSPFASARSIAQLPRRVVLALLEGLLAADLLGFQRRLWAERFLDCCELVGAVVDREAGIVWYGDHRVWIRCYPIPVDLQAAMAISRNQSALDWASRMQANPGVRLIVRVDRLDPSKNVVRGFQAFELLLDRNPHLRGHVHFVACLVPSRTDVPEYRWYGQRVREVVTQTASRYPGSLTVHLSEDRSRAMGALRQYEVLLVNPLLDGMNLVAQEGPLVNAVNGVVILSKGAGSADQLGDAPVLLEDPRDVAETASALETALDMPLPERQRRAAAMRASICSHDPLSWLLAQLTDLETVHAGGTPLTAP